jgi:lauroyl/myristoyl acyltransferase
MVRGLARAQTDFVMTGTSAARSLRTVLEEPGGVVAVAVDVFWGPGATHRRPFMGLPAWAFHPGPARLARLARCPIVLCVPIRTGERELTIHWGPFIEPPDPHNRESDARVTDELICRLEQVLSEHGSDQYTYPMTSERGRRWSRGTRSWGL